MVKYLVGAKLHRTSHPYRGKSNGGQRALRHRAEKDPLQHWHPQVGLGQRMICRSVVHLSRFVMQQLNRVEFVGTERWNPLFEQSARGILSFSNHVSLFDDPLLIANLGRVAFDDVRWIGADHKNFSFSFERVHLRCWKVCRLSEVPIGTTRSRLSGRTPQEGEWVHIFPEGGRTRDPAARMRTPFKLGIGQLLSEAKPIAMPFYHYGMHNVLPIGKTVPGRGHSVTVRFGHPTVVTEDWLDELGRTQPGDAKLAHYRRLADWSEAQLTKLEQLTHPTPDTPAREPVPSRPVAVAPVTEKTG